jgi:hypothetical protein
VAALVAWDPGGADRHLAADDQTSANYADTEQAVAQSFNR